MEKIDELLEKPQYNRETSEILITDGGRYKQTYYAWYNPDSDTLLYHTEANNEFSNPFFETEEEARTYLERLAESNGKEQYKKLSLQKLKAKKIGEAVEVLTDQAGIHDFATDGGTPEDTHQIPNPKPDRIWFWYDPSSDRILQEEVEPYDIRGVFDSEEDARDFINWYTEIHEIPLVNYFELYSADIELEGHGRRHATEQGGETRSVDKPPEQASLHELPREEGEEE